MSAHAPWFPFTKIFALFSLMLMLVSGSATAAAPATDNPTPARTFTFKRGISIGHWMAKVRGGETYGAAWFGPEDVDWIARQGFDHIRYPVDGRLWLHSDGTLDEPKIARFLEAVGWTRERGLGAVLDMHFLPGGGSTDPNRQDPAIFGDPQAQATAARFLTTVSQRLVSEGSWLRIELLNEPLAPHSEQLNELYRALIAAVRLVDPARVLYISSNDSGSFATLHEVRIPRDPHVALLLHYDEPMIFTHQRASWKQLPADMPLIHFPGRIPNLSNIVPSDHFAAKLSGTELTVAGVDADFERASSWLRDNAPGMEIYLGGFGSYEAAPAASRHAHSAAVRKAAERHGWSWAVWDYRSSFAVRDENGNPTPVLAGLFDR